MERHIIIVGAGPGGLAGAMRLAHAGYRVTVVEAEDRVGGRMRGFERDGYAFDTGPSIMQVPRVYDELFAECGLDRSDYLRFKQITPNTRIRFWDDTVLDLSSDLADFKRQIAVLRPDLPEAFDRWYAEHLRKEVIGYRPYLGTPVRPVLEYLNPREIAAALPFRPWESLYDHYWRFFKDERLVYGLSYPAKYLGMHPQRCSSVFSLVSWLEFAEGIWQPEGGFRAMAQAFARAAADLGVTIRLNTPVKQVRIERGFATGVELASGEQLQADAVVVNADFAHAMKRIIPDAARGGYTDAKLDRMHFSCSTFIIHLGIDKVYDLPHHSLYLSDHIRRTDAPFIDDSALDETNPSFYVCNPTPIDPINAPAGHSALFVLVPVPNLRYGVDWPAVEQRYRDKIIKRLAMLGYDDLEQHIRTEVRYTAQGWQDTFKVEYGAVFNLTHGWAQLGPLRPHIRSDAAKGLYYLGGAVHPGSGLLTILEAARSALYFISEDLPVAVAAT